jgi:hypothetical protein
VNAIDRRPADLFPLMLHAIDSLDWDTFRSTFTNEIALDYTSLWGGEPEKVTIDELVARWQPFAAGFDGTQHLTGPIVIVDEDHGHRATAVTTVRGYHHLVGDEGTSATWMVSGRYQIHFDHSPDRGWRISAITLALAYEEGDRGLVDIAQRRGATGVGGRTAKDDRASGSL